MPHLTIFVAFTFKKWDFKDQKEQYSMIDWVHPPWDLILAILFLLAAAVIMIRRFRRFRHVTMLHGGISHNSRVDREIFGTVIAAAFACFTIALFFGINWPVWLGLGLIVEELFQFLLVFIHYLNRGKK